MLAEEGAVEGGHRSVAHRLGGSYALMVHGSAVVYYVVAAVVMLWTPRPALEPYAALER